MTYDNILETIGNTPLVKINRMFAIPEIEVFVKIEGANPGGSIKDRIALKMIAQAEEEGVLRPGKTIIEPTSGNTGIALAMIGAVRRYPVEIVMSRAVSMERRKMIEAFGAKVILTDENLGTDGAIVKARELVAADPEKYFMPDQFSNHFNRLAHYETTATEIWEQMDGRIDYVISAIGTSGTIMGLSDALHKRDHEIKIVCAKPIRGHYIQGLKNMEEAIVPAIYDESKIDETIIVESEEAFEMARKLARDEGVFAGMSSGAALIAAEKAIKNGARGRIVVILPDRGEKYLSTTLFG